MRSLILEGLTGTTAIELGFPLSSIREYCSGKRLAVITDSTVYRLHGDSFPEGQTAVLGSGEFSKNLGTVGEIYEFFLSQELDRSSCIVGIGGGVVCDIAGFCASTYLRGVPFGYVPTTFLAQVDASVGGKNGVNLKSYKNLIGTFNQPQFVLCDFKLLSTLPEKEVSNGFAEVIKHALIGNSSLFSQLEENHERIMSLDEDILEEIVNASLQVKIKVVSQDEKENGYRRILNFGHTIGHGVEKTLGLSHGESVSIGMVMEAGLSAMKGKLYPKTVERIKGILENFGLSVKASLDKVALIDAIRKDKKREDDEIHCVLLEGIGSAKIDRIKIEELEELFDDLCEYC
jgi:3-dehydroquinate synthase